MENNKRGQVSQEQHVVKETKKIKIEVRRLDKLETTAARSFNSNIMNGLSS